MKILIVSPHPDDETLGCGGTLLKHKDRGDELFWLIMTRMSEEVGYRDEQMRMRADEIKNVAEAYQFAKVFQLDFSTTTLDAVPRRTLMDAIAKVINEIAPEAVYLPHRGDIHSDHRVTFEAAMGTLKSFRAPSVKKVLAYEVLSETEFGFPFQSEAFVPNNFSDISPYLEKKIAAMKCYQGEIRPHPFPRSPENVKALATLRGATAGVKYAEAFMILREIW